ncbi:MAG: AEC family transporter [Lachnospiraceae bacterium]|uniref:AEC family transporter n=1 Tax=Clostridium sp. (strain SY8519) TaxID=1042156 RepID=UPI0002171C44|nr:AEC family transporter [Clostridium sp. SY8519]MCI1654840.1 AEC family transporter [Lachnospiraceae bacterium]MCI1657103.1 AEC family transporter [Lachnospiraceae bacterium]MCI2195680.1 AEC family transporter [Lachnospiraceae bacterium]BAK46509.1 hypothetical protein CXIVA_05420 [Clostridium sp. SY8519]
MAIAVTMCKLLITMGIGFYLFKKNIFNERVNGGLSAMIVQIACPCIIINSVASVPHDNPEAVIRIFIAGILSYFLFIGLGYVFTGIMRVPKFLKGTYICMFVFANAAFMGFPVVQALFGDVAIFYVTIFNMPFNLFMFTLGPHYFKKDASLEDHPKPVKKTTLRDILNNGLIASVIALVIYFGNIQLPEAFYSVVSFVGNMTTPLSMICIGSSLAAVSMRQIREEKGVWIMLPLRLAVIPAIVWGFLHLFLSDPTLIAICTISTGMPVASLVAMVSGENKRQNQAAAIGVALSTICSMVTIPIMAALLTAGT